MEYLDFSSVITIIRKYINDERTVVDRSLNEEVKIDQMHLLDQVFASFCDDADSLDFAFDNGQVGEKYSVWLTLDPSFPSEHYTFNWHIECGRKLGTSSRLDIDITEDMIRERCAIYCEVKSTKSWHRYNGYDQQFAVVFQVLPPDE